MRRTMQIFIVSATLLVSAPFSWARNDQVFTSISRFCSASDEMDRQQAATQLASQLVVLAKKKAYHPRIAADAAQEAFVYVLLNCHQFTGGRWDFRHRADHPSKGSKRHLPQANASSRRRG